MPLPLLVPVRLFPLTVSAETDSSSGSVAVKDGAFVPAVGEAFENGYADEDTSNGASGY
jgi:hypothetical protein